MYDELLRNDPPGTDEPGADEPGTDEPGTDEPPSNPIRSNRPGNQYIHSPNEQDINGNEPNDSYGKQNANGNDGDGNHSRPYHPKPITHEREPDTHEREPNTYGREPNDYDQEPNAHTFHQDYPSTGIKRRTQNAGNELMAHNIIRERILEKVLDHQKLKEDFHALFVITTASLSINIILLFQVFKYM